MTEVLRGRNGGLSSWVRSLTEKINTRLRMQADAGMAFTYFALFLFAWYVVLWIIRLVLSIVWPVFLIATAVVIFRILQVYEPQEVTNTINRTFTILTEAFTKILSGAMDFCLDCFQ